MQKNPYPGKFIVFEGLDGSGQSTQTKLLGDFLKKERHQVILTKEPTLASQAGKKIKKILDEKIKIEPAELQELFARDREEHLKNLILPALAKEEIVISDRYFFSSFAYGALNLDLTWLIQLNNNFILPDLTFFLDASAKICLERIKKRKTEITLFEKKEKLEKVRENYRTILAKFDNIYTIDGGQSIEKILKEVKEIVINKLNL